MEWEQVRAHYERAFEASGLTQSEVARRGGLRRGKPAQNAISKLLNNRKKGPSVATLLGAIAGLGLTPVQFFNQIENDEPATAGRLAPAVFVSHRADEADLAWFRRFMNSVRTAVDQSNRPSTTALRPRKRRARRAS